MERNLLDRLATQTGTRLESSVALRRHLLRPDGAAAEAATVEIDGESDDMMDQTEVGSRQSAPTGAREVYQLGEGRHAGDVPVLDLHLDLGGHEKVGDFAGGGFVVDGCDVHVIAAAVVFGAVPAMLS